MASDITIWIGGAATILAAFIGGIVAITSTVIAKEQKISEFRQAWIDAFRNDIVELISCGTQVASLASLVEIHPEEFVDKSFQARANYMTLATRIQLRLNNGDATELMSKIGAFLKLIVELPPEQRMSKSVNHNGEIMFEAQNIISIEWQKIKKGELISRFFVSSGKVLICAALSAFFIIVLSANFPQYCPIVG